MSKSTPHGLAFIPEPPAKEERSTDTSSSQSKVSNVFNDGNQGPDRQTPRQKKTHKPAFESSPTVSSTPRLKMSINHAGRQIRNQQDHGFEPALSSSAVGSARNLSPMDALRDKQRFDQQHDQQKTAASLQSNHLETQPTSFGVSPVMTRFGDRLAAEAPIPFHFRSQDDMAQPLRDVPAALRQLAIDHDLGSIVSLSELCEAHEVRLLACTVLHGLSSGRGSALHLRVTENAWRALAELVQHRNERVMLDAAWALAVLASYSSLRHALVRFVDVATLLRLLRSDNERLQLHAALTVSSLAMEDDLHEELTQAFFSWSVAEGDRTDHPKLRTRIATFWANLSLSDGCAVLIAERAREILFRWLKSASKHHDLALARSVLNVFAGILMAVSDEFIRVMLSTNNLADELSKIWLWRATTLPSSKRSEKSSVLRPEDLVEMERVSMISLATCMPACDDSCLLRMLDVAIPRLFTLIHASRDSDTLYFACNAIGVVAEYRDGKYVSELVARGASTGLRDVIRKSVSDASTGEAQRVIVLFGNLAPVIDSFSEQAAKSNLPKTKRLEDGELLGSDNDSAHANNHSSRRRGHKSGSAHTSQQTPGDNKRRPDKQLLIGNPGGSDSRSVRADSVRGPGISPTTVSVEELYSQGHVSNVLRKMDMLNSGVIDSLVTSADIVALRELALHAPSMQGVLAATGQKSALGTLVKLLGTTDSDLRIATLLALAALCQGSAANRSKVGENGGLHIIPRLLIHKARDGAAAAQAVAALAWDSPEIAAEIVNVTKFVLPRLARMLATHGSPEIVRASAAAIYALCSQCCRAQAIAIEVGIASQLEQMLEGDDTTLVKIAAASALAAVLARNPVAQRMMRKSEFAQALVDMAVERAHVPLQSAVFELIFEWAREDRDVQQLLVNARIVAVLAGELENVNACFSKQAAASTTPILSTENITSKKHLLAINDSTRVANDKHHDEALLFYSLNCVSLLCNKGKFRKLLLGAASLQDAVRTLAQHRNSTVASAAETALRALRGKKVSL